MEAREDRWRRWLAALALFTLARPGVALACPECRLAVRRAVYDGHFGARAAMMFAPFASCGALAAGLAWWIDRRSRRNPR
jgi:hypothetical protein